MSDSSDDASVAIGSSQKSTGCTLRWIAAYALVFVAILLARWEIIDSPPCFDYAVGIWAEADYLVESGFDYYRLRYEERLAFHPDGGTRNYLISVLPTFIAILMTTFSKASSVLITYHLFVFACATFVAVVLYAILRESVGRISAALATAAAMTTPVFCTQIDMLGMELPLTAAAMLTAWCLWRGNYGLAAGAATLAFFVKPSGAIITLASIYFLVLVTLCAWSQGNRRWAWRAFRGVLLCSAALVGQLALLAWAQTFENYDRSSDGSSIFMIYYWVPDLALVFAVAILACVTLGIWHVKQHELPPGCSRKLRSIGALLSRAVMAQPMTWFSAIVTIGLLLAIHVVFFIPRYLTLGVPFFYLATGAWVLSHHRLRPLASVLLACVVVLNLLNWNGRFYMSHRDAHRQLFGHLGWYFERESTFHERSHEYLAEHRENQDAARFLEQHCADVPIIAGHPYNYFLSLPRLGYVSQPLRGYSTCGYANAPQHFLDVAMVLDDSLPDAVFVWVANRSNVFLSKLRIPLPTARDEVLYRGQLDSPLIIYRKRFPPYGPSPDDWLEAHIWHTKSPLQRAAAFARLGRFDNAVAIVRRQRFDVVDLVRQSTIVAGLLAASGRHQVARREFLGGMHYLSELDPHAELVVDVMPTKATKQRRSPGELISAADRTDSRDGQVLLDAALDCIEREDLQGAARHLERLVRVHLPDVDAATSSYLAGVADHRAGRYGAAAQHLARAIEHCSDLARAHFHMGLIYEQQGHREKALDQLQIAQRLVPDNAETYDGLGVIFARAEDFEAAVECFTEALRLEPDLHLAQAHLEAARRRLAEQVDQAKRLADTELFH